jgi:hypothetical protein
VEVVSAFQNVSFEHLLGEANVECDVLVTGTSKNARLEALKLVEAAGLTGWDAGPIENSVVAEGLTSVLVRSFLGPPKLIILGVQFLGRTKGSDPLPHHSQVHGYGKAYTPPSISEFVYFCSSSGSQAEKITRRC